MGRQVRFYMLSEDEDVFASHLREDADVVIVNERSAKAKPVELERFPAQGSIDSRLGTLIWNRRVTDELVWKHLGANSWIIDKMNSEVIEMAQSEILDGGLQSGRIWIETTRLDADRIAPKSVGFLSWYERLAKWLRKHYTRHENGIYLAPSVVKWVVSGGRLGS